MASYTNNHRLVGCERWANWIVISHRFLRDLCLLINWPVVFIIPPCYFRDAAFCSGSFRWCEHGLDAVDDVQLLNRGKRGEEPWRGRGDIDACFAATVSRTMPTIRSWMRATMGYVQGWPRKLILNERATYSNSNFFHRYSSNLQYRSISIELASKIKKKCGKKRDSSMFYNNANNRIVISIGPMNDQFEQLKFLPKDIFAISLLVIHASIFGVSSLRRRLTAVSPSINSIHREPRRDQFPVHTPSQARNESATRALSPRRPSISVARLPDTR